MSIDKRLQTLEKRAKTANLCTVVYKVGRGPTGGEDGIEMPLEEAVTAARAGLVKRIEMSLTFDEEQAEAAFSRDYVMHALCEYTDGIRRDASTPDCSRLILCSLPIVYAHQAPPQGRCGGYFETDAGEIFHQSQWREALTKHNAGFIIVKDYDETKEPWWIAGRSRRQL